MTRTIIIDDEPLATQIVQEYLEQYPDFEVIQVCHDGFAGLKALQEHKPDLIFLDVQMPKLNGFELLELLEDPPAVIFTTAFDNYAVRAFDAHAIDYLLKPISRNRFEKAIEKFKSQDRALLPEKDSGTQINIIENPDRVVVKVKQEIKIIPLADIHYLEANDDFVNIITKEGKFLKNRTLTSFEKWLDPTQFVRVHRSYLVNISEIVKIENYEKESHLLRLKSGHAIPVSKTGYPRLKQALGI
jgi:two-component system, LytTR family, response regulator